MRLFLHDEIKFGQIPQLVSRALDAIPVNFNPTLADILEADRCARALVCEGQ